MTVTDTTFEALRLQVIQLSGRVALLEREVQFLLGHEPTTYVDKPPLASYPQVVELKRKGKIMEAIAAQGKPVLLATGASTQEEVDRAVAAILNHTRQLCLMQCNTNYTGNLENFAYVNLNVLKSFAVQYPGMVLGLSDHTPGHAAVLGAVAFGARIIEKHFTDDNSRTGPDQDRKSVV